MKLSISNIAWDFDNDNKIYALMKKYSYEGLEIAPTRIIPEAPYDNPDKAVSWKQNIDKEYGFEIPSMQSIWFGKTQKLFGSEQERKELLDYTCRAVDFAKAVKCGNLVFGSPKNRVIPDISFEEEGVRFFKTIGEYALKNNTVIGMEANPAIYNTNYINTTVEAIELIDRVECDGFKLNLDIGSMISNNEKVEMLENKLSYINHVHISEPFLKPIEISKERRSFLEELSVFLKENGYDRFVSVEMGKSDISLIEETLAYVKEIFG